MSYLIIKDNQQYWVVKLTCKKSTIIRLMISVSASLAAVVTIYILRMLFR